MTYRVYLRSHAAGTTGQVDRATRTVTPDPATAEAAFRALLGRVDLVGQPVAAVLSSTAPSGGSSGSAIYFSRFDREIGDARIDPAAPLNLLRLDDGTAEASAWQPPAESVDWEVDPRPLAECLKVWHAMPGRSRAWAANELRAPQSSYLGWCAGKRPGAEGAIRRLMTMIDRSLA